MVDGSTDNLVEMRGIEKHFGRVVALNGVDLEVREGEIMGLLGDNGSGKSTLIKTLVGVHQPDAGEVYIRGERVRISNPKEARKYGISTVYQDLALVDTLSVSANLFLARNPMKKFAGVSVVDWDTMNEQSEEIIRSRLNLEIDPTARVEFLSGGERQAIAIARSLVTDPDLVIMDEPTSALSADSARRVRELVRTLNDEGITVLLITHNMDEVFGLTDRVTILDSGDLVGTVDTDAVTKEDIVQMMVSGEMPADLRTASDTEAQA
ncbi:ATP-binding cassette domain-containing protein [Halomicroarcula limicola]|uniref:ATP-binding cassette domain-containing protein n=1 Tax=Haloarcula limicola TaxID=1429915 RepID=A0A8J7Y7D6_9EURY|nr:ATP-binding cassette domain-containing protein [Halomicroarcula limicola]MBV0923043.1 ATP-binding cassette domain-containing protein [Halomicroarcula limicola]